MPLFEGLVATPVTSFDEQEIIYEPGIRNLVQYLKTLGIDNLFCIGSWGGFALMRPEERKQVAKIFIDEAQKNSIKTIINISSTSTKDAVELARHAQDTGADAVATTWPYYYTLYGYTQNNILSYLDDLIKAVDIPVHFYNNARTTGIPLDIAMFKRIIDMGISGMKEGGGNLAVFYEMMDYLKKNQVDFDLMPSSVTMMLNGLISGVKATMIGSAMAFGEIAAQTLKVFQAGDIDHASRLHEQLMMIRKIHGSYGFSPAACYSLLKLRGIDVGHPRRPWLSLSDPEVLQLKEQLIQTGIQI